MLSTQDFAQATHIQIMGQRVTFDRDSISWIATGWEKGLPVARKPITEEYLKEILSRFDSSIILMTK